MKKMKNLALLTGGLLLALGCAPQGRADTFEDANRAFASGNYAESAEGYKAVIKSDGYSPAVLFNLANADLRSGKTGEAILDYERAKWLAPHDADIAANLQLACKQAGVAEAADAWGGSVANYFSPNAWAWLAVASLAVLCAGIYGVRLGSRQRGLFGLSAAAGALVLFLAGGALALRYQELDRAVLTAKATPALVSPFTGAKTACEFRAGQTVQVGKAHGGFYLVRDLAGHGGWVGRAQIGWVAPSST